MANKIHSALKLRVENRLGNFEKLIKCIKSDEPIKAITEHLGISI